MRTTLTLDPDVVRLLEDEAHRRRAPFKQVVNDAVRSGLARKPARGSPYRVEVHDGGGLRPGIDPSRLNQLADELEVDAFIARAAGAPKPAPRRRRRP